SHHWVIDEMFGLPYDTPVAELRDHLDVLVPALTQGTGVVSAENGRYRVRYPFDITDIAPTPILLAALGPAMLRLAGERADGTILWMADERAIGDHIAPTITKAAEGAGRRAPRVVAGVPVCLCAPHEVEEAVSRTNRLLSEAEVSPNYQKLLDRGDARQIGDLLAAGTEEMIEERLRSFASAGATDVSIRVVPIGADRDAKVASSRRTRQYLASLGGTVT
ncbi:MAG: LLM class flavin-dependent oxidoreductase, partial [Acidimicrobiales bacterium]|nr:LLM class flavin-dependent oxidoreductase [Acidimicrobiales bacterium]